MDVVGPPKKRGMPRDSLDLHDWIQCSLEMQCLLFLDFVRVPAASHGVLFEAFSTIGQLTLQPSSNLATNLSVER